MCVLRQRSGYSGSGFTNESDSRSGFTNGSDAASVKPCVRPDPGLPWIRSEFGFTNWSDPGTDLPEGSIRILVHKWVRSGSWFTERSTLDPDIKTL